ncbi:hypothetical protein MZM54_26180 [[Brevibacterium] frigoritolerans]|nr:hypothetical protein [Peribacillus frigoritolerans]
MDEDRLTKCHNRGIKISTVEDVVKEALSNYKDDILEALNKIDNQDTSDLEQNLKNSLNLFTKELNKKERGKNELSAEIEVDDMELVEQNALLKTVINKIIFIKHLILIINLSLIYI